MQFSKGFDYNLNFSFSFTGEVKVETFFGIQVEVDAEEPQLQPSVSMPTSDFNRNQAWSYSAYCLVQFTAAKVNSLVNSNFDDRKPL